MQTSNFYTEKIYHFKPTDNYNLLCFTSVCNISVKHETVIYMQCFCCSGSIARKAGFPSSCISLETNLFPLRNARIIATQSFQLIGDTKMTASLSRKLSLLYNHQTFGNNLKYSPCICKGEKCIVNVYRVRGNAKHLVWWMFYA